MITIKVNELILKTFNEKFIFSFLTNHKQGFTFYDECDNENRLEVFGMYQVERGRLVWFAKEDSNNRISEKMFVGSCQMIFDGFNCRSMPDSITEFAVDKFRDLTIIPVRDRCLRQGKVIFPDVRDIAQSMIEDRFFVKFKPLHSDFGSVEKVMGETSGVFRDTNGSLIWAGGVYVGEKYCQALAISEHNPRFGILKIYGLIDS